MWTQIVGQRFYDVIQSIVMCLCFRKVIVEVFNEVVKRITVSMWCCECGSQQKEE